MKLPFISRGHHDSLVAELRKQLEEKEVERRLLWDFITGRMGYGSMFAKPEEIAFVPEEPSKQEELAMKGPEPRQMRASQLVRMQNRNLRNKSVARTSPSRAAFDELEQAKAEGIQAAQQ